MKTLSFNHGGLVTNEADTR